MGDGRMVFVTGGHGFVGSWVVRELLARGYRVRCLVRRTSRTHRIDGLPVERVVGDILEPASLAEGMRGADLCIHLAGISSYKDMQEDWTIPTIVDGTRNVLQAARDAGVGRTVYIGSGVIYCSRDRQRIADETSPFLLHDSQLFYAIGKHRAEQVVDEFVAAGSDVVVAIPMETYGPNDDEFLTTGYLKEAINGWPALATDGGVSFAHVEDVARGIVLALEKGRTGERYILGGENATIAEIIEMACEIAGKPKRPIVLPTRLTKLALVAMTKLGLTPPEHPNAVDYGSLYAFASIEKARRELGYNPRSGRETLQSTIDWLREAGHIA